jgi:hypothetical protein
MRRTPLALLLLLACKGEAQPVPRDISPGAAAKVEARQPDLSADAADPVQVPPLYGDRVPELDEARELCDALYLLPERRRSACCDGAGPGEQAVRRAGACSQILSSAVASGGVVLRDDALAGCITALAADHASCEWVGPWSPPLPAACLDAVLGTLTADARCRSNLECAPGLRCAGLGPTEMGVCSPPAPDGTPCDAVVDTLASHLRDERLAAHPGCAGRCVRGGCQPALAAGAACTSNSECASGLHCDGATCIAGEFAAAGEPCVDGGCAPGSRCLQRVCAVQGQSGDPCETDRECHGACLQAADGARSCGPRC